MCWTAICRYVAIPKAARVTFIYFTRKTSKKKFHFRTCIDNVDSIRFGDVYRWLLFADTTRASHTQFCQSHVTIVSVLYQSPCRKSYEIVQIQFHAFWILRLDLLFISFASPPFPWEESVTQWTKGWVGPHSRSGCSRESEDDSRSSSTYRSNCTKLHRLIDVGRNGGIAPPVLYPVTRKRPVIKFPLWPLLVLCK